MKVIVVVNSHRRPSFYGLISIFYIIISYDPVDVRYFGLDRRSLFPWQLAFVISAAIDNNYFIISEIGDRYFSVKIWSFVSLLAIPFASWFATWFAMCPNIRTYITHCIKVGTDYQTCSVAQPLWQPRTWCSKVWEKMLVAQTAAAAGPN